jgi:hypothetical protein
VALNCKRNLDVHQSPEDSRPYAERDGTSVSMTTAFGDGTKMHIENVVTANLSGLVPPPIGTPGVRTSTPRAAEDVRAAGLPDGSVHFTLGGDFGGGVLVLASSPDPEFDAPYLRYGKLGDGPWYPLFRPYHLIHMEVPTTIEQVLAGGPPLGRRTRAPVAACVAVAKRDLAAGELLDGIGGGACYGLAASSDEAEGCCRSAFLSTPRCADRCRSTGPSSSTTSSSTTGPTGRLLPRRLGRVREPLPHADQHGGRSCSSSRTRCRCVSSSARSRARTTRLVRSGVLREGVRRARPRPTVAQVNLARPPRPARSVGLHYQLPPAAEAKLVRCVEGAIFDVVVDTRPGSPTFGRWAGVELTADEGRAVRPTRLRPRLPGTHRRGPSAVPRQRRVHARSSNAASTTPTRARDRLAAAPTTSRRRTVRCLAARGDLTGRSAEGQPFLSVLPVSPGSRCRRSGRTLVRLEHPTTVDHKGRRARPEQFGRRGTRPRR